MRVLDLFCGAGGLACGFRNAGFEVTGVDMSEYAEGIFRLNRIGRFMRMDLSNNLIKEENDIIVGGPPCKPWAAVNLRRRGNKHEDYPLVSRFFKHIEYHLPEAFLLENVPPLANDRSFLRNAKKLRKCGYSILCQMVSYSNYGAPTSRRRLMVFGMKGKNGGDFFRILKEHRKDAKTVRDVIWHLRDKERGEVEDHIWPKLRTIHKYQKYYETGKFGWYILGWDEPAPSFGNVTKTYILHPDAFNNGEYPRVISVREALLITGFDRSFQFPEGMGIGPKYQMIADAVSPVFSQIAAGVIKRILEEGDRDYSCR
ncbi:MAG: DNA cytosine methyltransferase [Theionarchaea archaeon]|nr:DNA cytosine methyltransferase [Theionarchaea archaeon]